MSTDWTAYPYKRGLKTALEARAGITNLTDPTVKILTYFPGADEPFADSIILGYDIRDTKEKIALGGNTHDETVDVVCQVRAVRPGGGQTAADLAEDRAQTMLSEIDSEVRTGSITVTGAQIINPGVTDRESVLFSWTSGSVPGRVCIIEFTVRYKAKTAP